MTSEEGSGVKSAIIDNGNFPHTRFAMLHIHFIIFDPWMTRLEVRELFDNEFPGASRVCARRTKEHFVFADGEIGAGAQGYLEYASMEKIETAFGDESCDAVIEHFNISKTWTRHNRNFSFGKSIVVTGIIIDPARTKVLERENRLAWVKKNWLKLCYAERFIHLWTSGAEMIALGIMSMPNYRERFKERFLLLYTLHSNWVRLNLFEEIDFKGYLKMEKLELSKIW